MDGPRKVALLFGGESPEHEISIKSAAEVAAALDRLPEFVAAPVYITREGKWRWARAEAGASSRDLVLAAEKPEEIARRYEPAALDFPQALLHLAADELATILIMLHGPNGEDGRLQGAFEMAGLRYTGSGSAASALAMDKTRCQAYLAARGIPIPKFLPIQRSMATDAEAEAAILAQLGLPCVVKPALCGSSVGLTIVREGAQLRPAIELAFKYSPLLQAEVFIQGREFTCGVIEQDCGARALPVTEIIPPEGRFFDYEAKYTPGMTREVTPAQIDAALGAKIQRLAVEAHASVGCEGFSRVDFLCDADGPKVLEVNTIPGMTGTSLLPQAAAAAGIDFTALVKFIVAHSLRRGNASGACGGAA